ncbi:MAG: S-adenosylmethionine:tRNA ribosyltransferase-isomerase, partial [Chlorobium sp.]|nr:S-adenosylmethionine:tRNA ribosyltransferase-isomerase [Chlorobium sp.]
MRVSDFDYTLPEERIAKYPPENRGATRLLVLNRSTGKVEHARYEALDAFLCSGDLLVINTTKVV